ncbi:FAD-dependent oxidoreductase [Aeromicrobium sp. CTD01-1L150]|uniref:FAD-dependent oxidoreductase n=1 Tax=Aeromicrobium sp. CTD01-1L150 TaxID=3341830 RepID=UPI0035C1D2C3
MNGRTRHVAVVGGGPAGLAAAQAALDAGARVTLVESGEELGGQFWRHLPQSRAGAREEKLHHHWQRYRALRDALLGSPHCDVRCRLQIWAVQTDPGGSVTLVGHEGAADAGGGEPVRIAPDAVVLATGAHDRTLPFPGWTLPGVFTAGAAQAFAKSERIAVGRRVVVAGAGPFLLPVTASLIATEAEVVGVFEANRLRNLLGWVGGTPWKLLGAARKGGELAEYVGTHLRHRVPYRTGRAVVAAHGTDHVEAVTTARLDARWSPVPGTERRHETDAVCLSHGFTPRIELPIAAGCEITPDRFVRVDATQQTTVPGVYAAGEITSINGSDGALAEGTVAGHCAAGGADSDREIRAAVRRRDTFGYFGTRLETAHGIRPGWTGWLTEDTVLCRCEETTVGSFQRTVDATCSAGLRSVKLTTRAGLGICQARICGRTVEDYLAQLTDDAPGDGARSDRRPIATPVRLGDLARAGEHQSS